MWIRLSDDGYRDPSLLGLSDAAYRLRGHLLARSGEVWEQEGHLTDADVRMATSMLGWSPRKLGKLVAELAASGFMSPTENGWQVTDWVERYGRDADAVREERARNAERQARFRDRAKGRNAVSNAVTNAVSNGGPVPVPVPVDVTTSPKEARNLGFASVEGARSAHAVGGGDVSAGPAPDAASECVRCSRGNVVSYGELLCSPTNPKCCGQRHARPRGDRP